MDTLAVTIHAPRIEGDTVSFGWNQSIPNPHQMRNTWSFTYPGLDLRGFAPELLLEVFLALQIKVWATHPGPVEIRLPRPVPAWTVDFWRDYHRATNLDILPLAENRPADPWPGGASGIYPTYRNIVFFGGGKDSGAVASLLAEIDGPGSTLLLSHTASLDPTSRGQDLARRRIVEFIQQPIAAATGLPTATFWSDYPGNFRPEGKAPRPFLEFFHAGTLPLAIAHDARVVSVGHPRQHYWALATADQPAWPEGWSGRPETLGAIAAHYARAWNLDLTPTSVLYPTTTHAVVSLLADRYPAMYDTFVSCPSTGAPWCYACVKCVRTMCGTLAAGREKANFDVNRMLRSRVVAELVGAIRRHDPASSRFLLHPNLMKRQINLVERVSQLSSVNPASMDRLLARDTRPIFETIRRHYSTPDRAWREEIPRPAIAGLPPTLRAPLLEILAQHYAVVDDLPDVTYPDGSVLTTAWHIPLTLAGEVERLVPDWARHVVPAPPPTSLL
jgi:hypothetical protein